MRRAIVPPALSSLAAASGFSPAIRAGDHLYLTGATGGDAAGVMPPDAGAQARNALTKAMAILDAAHVDETAVVEMTSYHIDIAAHFDAIRAVVEAFFSAPLPAWTAVEVAGLRRPGALVEFRIVAHDPEAITPAPETTVR